MFFMQSTQSEIINYNAINYQEILKPTIGNYNN